MSRDNVTPWTYTVECATCGGTRTVADKPQKDARCLSTTWCRGVYVVVAKTRRIVRP